MNAVNTLCGVGNPNNQVQGTAFQGFLDSASGSFYARGDNPPGTNGWILIYTPGSAGSFNPAAPGPIGNSIPSTGKFTTVNGLPISGDGTGGLTIGNNSNVEIDQSSGISLTSSAVNLENSTINLDGEGDAVITANGRDVFDASNAGAAIITNGYTPSDGWVLEYNSELNAFIPTAP